MLYCWQPIYSVYSPFSQRLLRQQRKELQVLQMSAANSQPYSLVIDARSAATLAWGSTRFFPAKRSRWRSLAGQPANTVTILLESRILPSSLSRSPGWSWLWRPVLNPVRIVISIRIHPLYLGNHMPPQKLLVDVCIDLFAGGNRNDGTFLFVAAHHSHHRLLQGSNGEGSYMDVMVHLSHRRVRQVVTVAEINSNIWHEDFLYKKITFAWLHGSSACWVASGSSPSSFLLRIQGQMRLLNNDTSLHFSLYPNPPIQASHSHWLCVVMPFHPHHVLLQIFSDGCLNSCDGGICPHW